MNHTPINPTSKKQQRELTKRSKLKMEYIQEYGEVCMTCKNTKRDWRGLTLSHTIPLSRGGRTCRANCLLECFVCHELYEKQPEKRPQTEIQ
jgi:5-methylcytosine-specific restriction endonuclease McrA